MALAVVAAGILAPGAARGQSPLVAQEHIEALRADADGDGAPDRLGESVRIRAVTTLPAGHVPGAPALAVVHDGTGGLYVDASAAPAKLEAGSGWTIEGSLEQRAGRLILRCSEMTRADSVASLPVVKPDPYDVDLAKYTGARATLGGYLLESGVDFDGPFAWIGRPSGRLLVRPVPGAAEGWPLRHEERGSYVVITGVLLPAAEADLALVTVEHGDIRRVWLTPARRPLLASAAAVLLALGLGGLLLLGAVRSRRKNRWFQELVEQQPAALVVTDNGLHVLDANAAARRLLSPEGRRVQQKRLTELLHFEDEDAAFRLAETLRGGPATLEARTGGAKEQDRFLEVHGCLVPGSGRPRLAMTLHDVTFSREKFNRYETFLERLIDSFPIEVAILSRDGKYQYVNTAAVADERIRQWLAGRTDFDLCEQVGYSSEIALRRRSYRKQVVDTGEPVTFQEILPATGGGERTVLRTFAPHHTEGGEVQIVTSFGVDISEVNRLKDELGMVRRDAERLERLREALFQNVSHELRTPLSGILGYAQILEEEVPESLREFVQDIGRSGHRLMESLNRILDMAGLQADDVRMTPEVVDLVRECKEASARWRSAADEKGLFLNVRASNPEVLVHVDRASLQRVLGNLIGNAVKFTETGGVMIEISEDATRGLVRIVDTGVGIDRNFMPELYEAFQQEDAGLDRSFEGFGLGLAVTRRLVELMGGRIDAHSEKGQGSVFQVSFASVFPRKGAEARSSPLVLVADPSVQTARMLEHMLGPWFSIVHAGSAAEAARLASGQAFDAVLIALDLESDATPAELLAHIRVLPRYQDTPVVALDPESLPGSRKPLLDAGFDDYATKPVQKLELLTALVNLLALQENGSSYAFR